MKNVVGSLFVENEKLLFKLFEKACGRTFTKTEKEFLGLMLGSRDSRRMIRNGELEVCRKIVESRFFEDDEPFVAFVYETWLEYDKKYPSKIDTL